MKPARTAWYLGVAVGWLLLAVVAGATGLTESLHPPWPQLVALGLTVALVIAFRLDPGLPLWLAALGWRPLVALHCSRFVGLYFLVLFRRGALPRAFAVPGGLGDCAVASGAVMLLLAARWTTRHPGALRAWNVLGLVDIVFVVVTAARLGLAHPASMAALLRLPLSLLPTWLVPLIVTSHLYLLAPPRATLDERVAGR